MLGFIHRLYVEHEEDKYDDLIYLRLCYPYNNTGVFKAGKSYMIRSKTKLGCNDYFFKLRQLENIIPDTDNPKPFSIAYGNYAFFEHKEWYCDALDRYIHSKIERDEAFVYITKLKNKIQYLEKKFRELHPDFEETMSPEILF